METFPQEPISPPVWAVENFEELLLWAVDINASDIDILPDFYAKVRVHGRWEVATKNPIQAEMIDRALPTLAQNPGANNAIRKASDLDFSYKVNRGRGDDVRFRVNATGCTTGAKTGVNLVFRTIPSTPPTMEDLGLEDDLVKHLFPDQGLVFIAGTMGSGKSTLMGAAMRHVKEFQPHRKGVSFESPIEFDLTRIPGAMGAFTQTEIPTHLEEFARAPENATRRAIQVILVGESRDLETMWGCAEASEVGSATYTTVHTLSVAETVRRIVSKFPVDEIPHITGTILGNLKLLVYQTLVPKVGGGRVALREWLPISKDFRRELLEAEQGQLTELFHQEIYKNGMPLIPYAERKFEEGLITEDELIRVSKMHAFDNIKNNSEVENVAG